MSALAAAIEIHGNDGIRETAINADETIRPIPNEVERDGPVEMAPDEMPVVAMSRRNLPRQVLPMSKRKLNA
jgi:hypothetical protein